MRRAFTLIELMVAITILALLVAAAAVTYQSAQISSRDAKRVSDISTIGKAIDTYALNTRGRYPTFNTGVSCNQSFGAQLGSYLPAETTFPADPKPATTGNCGSFANGYMYYTYAASPANPATTAQAKYVLVTGLEKTPSAGASNILLGTSLQNVGSASGRTAYYLPGLYCGSNC